MLLVTLCRLDECMYTLDFVHTGDRASGGRHVLSTMLNYEIITVLAKIIMIVLLEPVPN